MKTLWFVPLVGLALLVGAGAEEERKKVPLYTNEDLDRLSPYRGQTGVLSEPAAETSRRVTPTGDASAPDEAYWRREAARVRGRTDALREQADEIRREIREAVQAARNEPWTSRGPRRSAPSTAPRERRLAAIEKRIDALETDLADRARAARALPGWLR